MLGPYVARMQVVAHDTDTWSVQALFANGQGPAVPVYMGTDGGNDQYRTHQEPLPQIGTWGIVTFPYGDNRAGVWMKAYPANLTDAYTTGPSDSPFTRYHARWSGYWEYQNGQTGETAVYYPDGSTVTVNASGGALPTMYYHTVNQNQQRQRVPLTQALRQPNGQQPANTMLVSHISGTKVRIDASGNVTASQPGGTMTLSVSGIGQVVISGNGVTINGESLISIGGFMETLYRLVDERMVALYNAHVHPTPAGLSSPPTVAMAVGSQTTTITYAG